MPNITVTLSNLEQSVTRPVMTAIIEQVRMITKISSEAEIFYPGNSQKMRTQGSSLDDPKNRLAVMDNKRLIQIVVEDDFDPESLSMTVVSGTEAGAIFADTKLGVHIAPVYTIRNVRINFKYRTPSETEASRWAADLRARISDMRDINLHLIQYSFEIPPIMQEIVEEIHKLREEVAGYGEDLGTYFIEHATRRLKVIGGEGAIAPALTIAETQERIQGLYDFSGLPEKPTWDQQIGAYVCNLSYKFTFDMPIACNMRFPISVHNQVLPDKYIDPGKLIAPYEDRMRANNSFRNFKYFETDSAMLHARDTNPWIVLPEFDDFVLDRQPAGTGTVFMALSTIDDLNESRTILDLNDLGDFVLDQDFLDFMRASEFAYMTKPYNSILQLYIYRNNRMIEESAIEVTPDLKVRAKFDLDPRDQHRVRLALVTDLTMPVQQAFDRARANPKVFVKYINAIASLLRNQTAFADLGSNQIIDTVSFDRLYATVTGMGGYYHKNFPKTDVYRNVPSRSQVPARGWHGPASRNYAYIQRQQQQTKGQFNNQGVVGFLDNIDPQVLEKFYTEQRRLQMRTVMTSYVMSARQQGS